MHVDQDDRARSDANNLATALFALEPRSASTSQMTRFITDAVINWAIANGWTPRVEARVEALTTLGSPRLGYLDVIVRRAGLPDLAIEIDSGDKPWSVDKLQHAAAAGMHAIWIRWGDEQWAGLYDNVDVIQLWLTRRPQHKGSADQIAIW